MKEGQALQGSPYVEQIEKYASSLKQLSHTFLELEAHKEEFSGADIDGMFDRVKERVCKKCEKNAWCWGENFVIRTRWDMTCSRRSIIMERIKRRDKEKTDAKMRESSEIFAGDAGRFQGCETNDHMDKPSGAKQGRVCVSDGSFCRYYETDSAGIGKKYFYG